MNQLDRVPVGGRVFALSAILGLSAATGSSPALQGALGLCVLAVVATIATSFTRASPWVVAVAVVEALLSAAVIALTLPDGVALLLYLPVPALVAGLSRGLWGVLAVGAAQAAALAAVWSTSTGTVDTPQYELAASWVVSAIGVGLLGSLVRQFRSGPPATDVSYESARRLVTQLRTVARRLSAGLDPVSMSAHILGTVQSYLADTRSGVFVRTEGGVLSPLAYRGVGAQEGLASRDRVVESCWAEMEPAFTVTDSGRADRRYRTALPLRAGNRMIGVVLADSPSPPDSDALVDLMRELDEHSLRLDTALVFDEVRSIATAEERKRLAREIHDGVAQEVASLGYIVDDLTSTATSATQREKLSTLRRELTRVVSELRLSIFDLRSEVSSSAGLGSALSDYVRQVGSRSNMTVHLTLDEAPTRLRSEVETELLRIAQEAVTNARRHSGATNLWVDVYIHPPHARIEVRDDGAGMKQGREDSYGLRIMRERATRIDAELEIVATSDSDGSAGTVVRATLN